MQRIRATLVTSTLLSALAFSGLAAAAPAPQGAPKGGGVPHANGPADAPAHTDAEARATPAPNQRVVAMQRALTARNLYNGKIDGFWGAKTEAALSNFQRQNNLAVTGKLDAPTAEKLGLQPELQPVAGSDAPHASQPQAAQPHASQTMHVRKLTADDATNVQLTALSTDQVKEMQQRLQLLGYYRGPLDGTVGEGTRGALQQFFQHQAELAANGQVSNAAIGLFGTEPSDIGVKK
jgi:peptidoglycan hydrolase-like protein with peptidoglycan-binding domain